MWRTHYSCGIRHIHHSFTQSEHVLSLTLRSLVHSEPLTNGINLTADRCIVKLTKNRLHTVEHIIKHIISTHVYEHMNIIKQTAYCKAHIIKHVSTQEHECCVPCDSPAACQHLAYFAVSLTRRHQRQLRRASNRSRLQSPPINSLSAGHNNRPSRSLARLQNELTPTQQWLALS